MQNSLVGLLFTYEGRINRAKYWIAVAIFTAIMFVLLGIGFIVFGGSLLALAEDANDEGIIAGVVSKGIGFVLVALAIYIPMLIAGIFVGIKRLHDRNKSGWWLLLFYLAPFILQHIGTAIGTEFVFGLACVAIWIWALVELGILKGTTGPNQYGPDPLG